MHADDAVRKEKTSYMAWNQMNFHVERKPFN
jgi:hypothetical protein